MEILDWIEILQTIGVPTVVAGASFWFIIYAFDSAQKERKMFQDQDRENDARIFQLAENSNQALHEMSKSLDANTASMNALIHRSN